MTIYTDSATVSSKTTPSSVDAYAAVDAATIKSVTAPSGVDELWRDSSTISTKTTIGILEVRNLISTDYDNATLSSTITVVDTSIPVYGQAGPYDTDNGAL